MAIDYWIESSPAYGSEYCGDFATCVDVDPHRRAIIVGDVAGHGIAASEAAAILSAYVCRLVARRVPLSRTLRAANDFFVRTAMNDATPFASLLVAVADLRKGQIHYASAGHEPGLLFNSDGASAHEHLDPTGPVLGLEPAPGFGHRTLPLFRDSLLVVVTDGITEARRFAGDRLSFFGTAGVVRAAHDAVLHQRDPAHEIYRAAVHHAGGWLSDDACVVASSLPFPNRVRLRPSAIDNLLVSHEVLKEPLSTI